MATKSRLASQVMTMLTCWSVILNIYISPLYTPSDVIRATSCMARLPTVKSYWNRWPSASEHAARLGPSPRATSGPTHGFQTSRKRIGELMGHVPRPTK